MSFWQNILKKVILEPKKKAFFLPNFFKKNFCGSKHTNQPCHQIWRIQNSLVTYFYLKEKMLIFWTKLDQEDYFKSKRRSNEWHYRIQHISIRLLSKSHLWQTVLVSSTRFPQKRYFQFKMGKVLILHNSA